MRERPIYSAACPCCASTLVVLAQANGHELAPYAWTCAHCGFTLMGLAVPVRPIEVWDLKRQYTCLEVSEITRVTR